MLGNARRSRRSQRRPILGTAQVTAQLIGLVVCGAGQGITEGAGTSVAGQQVARADYGDEAGSQQ